MRCRPAHALLLLILASFTSGAGLPDHRLTLDGLGPLKVGIGFEDFKDMGFRHDVRAQGRYAAVHVLKPNGIWLYFTDDRLDQMQIKTPAIQTLSGIGVGDTLEKVKHAYGKKLSYQTDTCGDAIPVLLSEDGHKMMVFWSEDSKLTAIQIGVREAIDLNYHSCADYHEEE